EAARTRRTVGSCAPPRRLRRRCWRQAADPSRRGPVSGRGRRRGAPPAASGRARVGLDPRRGLRHRHRALAGTGAGLRIGRRRLRPERRRGGPGQVRRQPPRKRRTRRRDDAERTPAVLRRAAGRNARGRSARHHHDRGRRSAFHDRGVHEQAAGGAAAPVL
ncbi:MAG: hypothetical protein AVDCRST_MAG08-4314, partial [uncultured Acetobacteraceae bacterium]